MRHDGERFIARHQGRFCLGPRGARALTGGSQTSIQRTQQNRDQDKRQQINRRAEGGDLERIRRELEKEVERQETAEHGHEGRPIPAERGGDRHRGEQEQDGKVDRRWVYRQRDERRQQDAH